MRLHLNVIVSFTFQFIVQVADDFVRRVQGTDISIISQEIFVNDPKTRVENMKVSVIKD